VFSRAKIAAKRASDSSNMSSLHQALQLYRQDQGGYPPLLMQVAEYDAQLNQDRNVDQLKRAFLFPSKMKDVEAFKAVLNEVGKNLQVIGCWPTASQNALQAFPPTTPVTYAHLGINPTLLNGDAPNNPARFYAWDSWDVQAVRGPGGPTCNDNTRQRFELRYILFWTVDGQVNGGGPNDDQRQLGYNDPPDSTVVTWNSYYRRWGAGNIPVRGRDELVLFLNGSVKPSDSLDVYNRSWNFGL
jgi:hypothetical protein